ncbi:exonuclease SbcCD subunit D [Umezawaea endophytica]|uniref:DNA repair exonuclease n=1 Tax=Umezawaea endophytica TaxID=1654476 RepID=A0A9X2VIK0_9PSEU|nr:DNA repair exonuclease [Umezawaea endophytica]MCS7477365.1 DNA repair exonuclease [Umezawaea endophytica]
MRIVHAADIHLDSPMRGLSRFAGDDLARRLRRSSRDALENLVRLVVDERAQALVLAGDIYDGDWPDYATGKFFADQMDFLHQHGIRVFMVAGNHDAESVVTKAVRLPKNVDVLSTDQVETVIDGSLGLAVHGQGYAVRAVRENLALSYPDRTPGLVNIGVLHTAVTGAEGHEPYAPCTPSDLEKARYEYFALGHVHKHRVVNGGQWVAAFSGNLQGRHVKETGPKGALVVDLEVDAPASVRFVPLDVARWADIRVDASDRRTFDDVLDSVEEHLGDARAGIGERPLVARVTVEGTTAAAGALSDRDRLSAEVSGLAERRGVTLEKAVSRAVFPRAAGRVDEQLIEAIKRRGGELAVDVDALLDLVKPLDREFGRVLRAKDSLDLRDEDFLRGLTESAINGLVAKLSSGEA